MSRAKATTEGGGTEKGPIESHRTTEQIPPHRTIEYRRDRTQRLPISSAHLSSRDASSASRGSGFPRNTQPGTRTQGHNARKSGHRRPVLRRTAGRSSDDMRRPRRPSPPKPPHYGDGRMRRRATAQSPLSPSPPTPPGRVRVAIAGVAAPHDARTTCPCTCRDPHGSRGDMLARQLKSATTFAQQAGNSEPNGGVPFDTRVHHLSGSTSCMRTLHECSWYVQARRVG